jgi:small nuclear ribonucleoprotein (snRNP)-like protein
MDILLEKFNNQLNLMLDDCKIEFTPTVCNLISTEEGRKKVFTLIRKKVILENITIGQAINSIEQEFNPNSYSE